MSKKNLKIKRDIDYIRHIVFYVNPLRFQINNFIGIYDGIGFLIVEFNTERITKKIKSEKGYVPKKAPTDYFRITAGGEVEGSLSRNHILSKIAKKEIFDKIFQYILLNPPSFKNVRLE